MIDLTPLEVRKKKGDFRRVMRGYDMQSVDDFLDLVADRLEQLVRENIALSERAAATDTQVSDYREREKALTEALVTAQEMREEMRRQMEREAELKRREAEAEADAVRAGALQMREREEENLRRLRMRQIQFVQSYKSFLERELAELSVMAETLEYPRNEEDAPSAPVSRAKPATPAAPPRAEPEALAAPPVVPLAAPVPEPPPAPVPVAAEEVVPEEVAPEEVAPAEVAPAAALAAASEPPEAAARYELDIDVDQQIASLSLDQPPKPAAEQPADDVAELELIDEVTGEDESDGWVSSLLEGKGD